jgi:coenzyme F420-0:L-glutamate ligase/coenzyme F420-1:gamma-L-glutamate ligase
MSAREVRLIPVRFPDEVRPGDDLAEKLQSALQHQRLKLQAGDILVIKHKIVSKAEGQVLQLNEVKPSRAAKTWAGKSGADARLVELALREGRRIVRKKVLGKGGSEKRGVMITETRHGLVCANSGVDASRIPTAPPRACGCKSRSGWESRPPSSSPIRLVALGAKALPKSPSAWQA